jgi:hypothetical protein
MTADNGQSQLGLEPKATHARSVTALGPAQTRKVQPHQPRTFWMLIHILHASYYPDLLIGRDSIGPSTSSTILALFYHRSFYQQAATSLSMVYNSTRVSTVGTSSIRTLSTLYKRSITRSVHQEATQGHNVLHTVVVTKEPAWCLVP